MDDISSWPKKTLLLGKRGDANLHVASDFNCDSVDMVLDRTFILSFNCL